MATPIARIAGSRPEAEMWNNRAVEVWGMNYPGFGGSTGPARLARLGPAALAALDALKRAAGDRRIIVFGASLGTTTALHVAAHRQVAGLILHNPPPLRQIILRQFGWWNLWLLAGCAPNSKGSRQSGQQQSGPRAGDFSTGR